jgi:LPXTG-motif cell wall-anchored protein
MLHLEYDWPEGGGFDGTTLYTIMPCNLPGEAVAVEDTVATVAVGEAPAAGTDAPQSLPETGAGLTMAVIAAVLVVAGGFTMFGARRRTADITD